jgi:serine/threonine protein kinase
MPRNDGPNLWHRLGPFEIVAVLGAGGMGEVYRAKDTRLGRDVAIKILPPNICADPIAKQRFEREAKTISGLNHPNICVLYDIGSHDARRETFGLCGRGKWCGALVRPPPGSA